MSPLLTYMQLRSLESIPVSCKYTGLYFKDSQWKGLHSKEHQHHVALSILCFISKGLMAVEDKEFQAIIPFLMDKEFRTEKGILEIVGELTQK